MESRNRYVEQAVSGQVRTRLFNVRLLPIGREDRNRVTNGLEVWSQWGSLWAGSPSSAGHAEELPARNRESYQGESTQTRVQLQCKSGCESYLCVEARSQMRMLAFTEKSNRTVLPAAANAIAAAICISSVSFSISLLVLASGSARMRTQRSSHSIRRVQQS